jgi:hypothetical protein
VPFKRVAVTWNNIIAAAVSLSGQSPLPVADNVNVRVVDTVVRDLDGKHQFR